MNEMEEQSERDGAGGVFGVALGLILFAITILVAVASKAGPLDAPAEVWATHFEGSGVPSGFEISAAALLPGDKEVVKLRRVGAPEIAVPVEDAEEPSENELVEWSAIEEGERGLAPDELMFVFYPTEASGEMFETYFQDLPRGGANELESNGGTVILESGELNWLEYETHYVRQREFRLRGGQREFVDTLRVNLSVGQSCVLIALWPAGVPSSVEPIEEVLAQVEPRTQAP